MNFCEVFHKMNVEKLRIGAGKRMEAARKEAKYSRESVAEMLGKSLSSIRRIELGQAPIDVETLLTWHALLGADLNWIIAGEKACKPEWVHAPCIVSQCNDRIKQYKRLAE